MSDNTVETVDLEGKIMKLEIVPVSIKGVASILDIKKRIRFTTT